MQPMIKIFFYVLFLVNIISAQDPESIFKQAVELYQKANYDEAIQLLEGLNNQGYQGAALFYNLGNAYFRAGKLGYAILYFEKAKKLSPSDEDINYNLSFANSRIVDKVEALPRFFIFDWWEQLLAAFSITGWTYTAYIFYFLILLSIAYYFFARTVEAQRVGFYSAVISSFLLAFSIVLLLVNLNRELNVKYAVVTDQQVVAKFSPDQNSKDAFIIHEGIKVKAEDSIDGWIKIKLLDGKVGWINKKSMQII